MSLTPAWLAYILLKKEDSLSRRPRSKDGFFRKEAARLKRPDPTPTTKADIEKMQPHLRQLIPEDEIHSMIRRLSAEIRADNPSSEAVIIGVMKGAFVFMADLVRELGPAFEVDFMQAASYGHRDTPSEEVRITSDISVDIKGRDVIVVEGIIDRGNTARAVVRHLDKKGPSSIRLCTLLLRKGHSHDLTVDYIGRQIEDGFVVGYGMDHREKYRGLKGLFTIDRA